MLKDFSFLNQPKEILFVLEIVILLLVFFTTFFFIWSLMSEKKELKVMNLRMRSWWIMVLLFMFFMLVNKKLAITGIAFMSFIALREILSSLNLRQSDRWTTFCCFAAIPLQFWAAYAGLYGFFIIFIPVIMFIVVPLTNFAHGDIKDITRSVALIQWSFMLTVFSFSHLAFLFSFPPQPGFSTGNHGLVLYVLFLTQFNDILQFLCGKSFGKHKILPSVSPNKTWEGFLGGFIFTTALGYYFSFLTFFTPVQAIISGAVISFAGFAGDLNVSAVKRDIGIKDMGNLIPGHGGIMDRIDSLSYTSLAFFHLAWYWRA